MRWFSLSFPCIFGACLIGMGVNGCVGDDPAVVVIQDSGAGDPDGTPAIPDSSPDAPTSSCTPEISRPLTLNCFGSPRCTVAEKCCIALGGADTIVGQCSQKVGNPPDLTCPPNFANWECDKATDCLSGDARCCVGVALSFADQMTCPLVVNIAKDAPAPPSGKASMCTQGGCGALTMLCERDLECDHGKTCKKISIQGSIFGACL